MDTKYKVIISKKAENQIEDIYNYISANLYNKPAAEKLMSEINLKFKYIESFPFMYQMSELINCRKCTVDNYILFYEVHKKDKSIYILSMYHGSQDYDRFF